MVSNIILIGGSLKAAELIQRIYTKKNSDLFGTNIITDKFVQRFSTTAFMKALVSVNREDYVKSEMLKALKTLKIGKSYSAESHAMTVMGIRKLVKDSFIEKETFAAVKTGKEKTFAFEKVAVGNWDIKKEHAEYKVEFATTGKQISPEYILEQMKNPEMFKMIKDKEGNAVDIKLDIIKNLKYKVNQAKERIEATINNVKEKEGLQMIHKMENILGHLKDRKTPELKEL